MFDTKRTRSQILLPDFNFDILTRSPLKDARIALRNTINTSAQNDFRNMDNDDGSGSTSGRQAKRPLSPMKDSLAQWERVRKKLKRDEGVAEDESTKHTRRRFPKRPSSTSSVPSSKSIETPVSRQRARSIPVDRNTPIPQLDLSRMSPSPWRSPSKSTPKLLITKLPSMETIQDVDSGEEGAQPSVPSQTTQPDEGTSSTTHTAGQPFRILTRTVSGDVIMSSPPLSPPPTSPIDPAFSSPAIATQVTPPRRHESSLSRPLSPLTPLPPTPLPTRIPVYSSDRVPRPSVLSLIAESSHATLAPKTPSSASRLPRLSMVPPPPTLATPSTSNTTLKRRQPSKARATKPAPTIPLGGRVTRSASLRKKKEESHAVSEAPKAMTRSESGTRCDPDASQSDVSPPSTQTTLQDAGSSRTASSSAAVLPRKRSSSLSYAQPTASSAAKVTPSSPIKPHSVATSFIVPSQRFSFTSRISQPPPSSSLSSLSMALAKLDVPRPSRPNTSLGFNRELTRLGNDDGNLKEKSSLTLGSKDDSGIGKRRATDSSADRPQPVKRASTVGSIGAEPGSSTGPSNGLMLPPPVPRVKQLGTPDAVGAGNTDQLAPKKISVSNGMVAGKPKGNVSFGLRQPTGAMSKPRIFGSGAFTGLASRSRVVHRASRETTLPTVEGSPVKGGAEVREGGIKEAQGDAMEEVIRSNDPEEDNVFLDKPSTPQVGETSQGDLGLILAGGNNGKGKGKEKSTGPRNDIASCRVSLASQLLSQSLSALPQTPVRAPPAKEVRVGNRPGLRSASSNYPSTSKAVAQTAPGALGRASNSGNSNGAHVSAHGTVAASATSPPGSAESNRGSLKVLKNCKIFVDVRTDEGDDAGALFVDMLKGLGAKVLGRVGSTCTHIIYKNGLMSTLTRYRLMNDPKPLVVGIAWVVECVEQRTRVDETKFLVDLELVNVAGTNKRRRSMLPKHLSGSMIPIDMELSPASGNGDRSNQSVDSDQSADIISPITVVDNSPAVSEDSLPPLERARRRRSNFFAPRT